MTNSIDRRDFFKLAGSAAVVAGAASIAPTAIANTVTNICAPKVDPTKRIHVTTEYGKLNEIFVGRAPHPDDLFIEWNEKSITNMKPWLKPETAKMMEANAGKRWEDALGKEVLEQATAEIDGLAKTLEDLGVTVHRPPRVTGEDAKYLSTGIDQIFPRDVFCTVGNTTVVSSLRMDFKRKQQYTFTSFYKDIMKNGQGKFFSTPQATMDIFAGDKKRVEQANEDAICLDGGDFVVDGKNIYLGIGKGSNMNGYEFVKSMFGDEYIVTPFILDKKSLHLDCALSILSPNLALICREWIKSELPESLSHYTFIDVTPEEAAWLGCNGLPVSPDTVIMDPHHARIVAEVRKHGHNVIEQPFQVASMLGGALRCATQPINRDDV
ncbi:NG,NG-dimethylarginine dimethylaminohydrolase 1 [Vibrio maritimus]|uniref:NG,NG-dimethylarginine dimethylaminohydrolase 1 n=1 Tax=Vibrio maritimus TaxID=990268 RepID=A0A090RQX5_9VIBR|nr:NG,NG-dimethylarginine dimethylaminohydrolase 1 [Vibrio maritimus]